MEIKARGLLLKSFLGVSFFTALVFFLLWLEPFSDFPHTDEYQSLLSALGFPVYTPDLYVRWLSLFSWFSPDFQSLVKTNFIASHFFLALTFFLFHSKKKIAMATNLTMTALLTLSTINVALTRKMHFWAAGFFFLILFFSETLEGKRKNIFIVCGLTTLGFFRREFFLCAALAGALMAGHSFGKKGKLILLAAGSAIAFSGIFFFGYGMKELLIESFQLQGKSFDLFSFILMWTRLFFTNAGLHIYYSFSSIASTVLLYFPGLAMAVTLLVFLVIKEKRLLQNLKEVKKIFLFIYLPLLFPALFALYSVRFMDFYVITTFVFILSLLSFLLNSRTSLLTAAFTWAVIIPAFFLMLPDLKESADINFPTYRRGELVHRKVFELIEKLDVKPGDTHYKILFNQYVAGVLPFEGRDYFMFSDLKEHCQAEFDIVLLPGKWFIVPEQNLLRNCILPRLGTFRHVKIAPGYGLYLSSRISPEKFPLK